LAYLRRILRFVIRIFFFDKLAGEHSKNVAAFFAYDKMLATVATAANYHVAGSRNVRVKTYFCVLKKIFEGYSKRAATCGRTAAAYLRAQRVFHQLLCSTGRFGDSIARPRNLWPGIQVSAGTIDLQAAKQMPFMG
jgi:hypothetical protein